MTVCAPYGVGDRHGDLGQAANEGHALAAEGERAAGLGVRTEDRLRDLVGQIPNSWDCSSEAKS